MKFVGEIAAEFLGMFIGDRRLAAGILAIVAAAASLADKSTIGPFVGGGILIFGCPILLIVNVWRAALPHEGRTTKRRGRLAAARRRTATKPALMPPLW